MTGMLQSRILNDNADVELIWKLEPPTDCIIYSNTIYYTSDKVVKQKSIIPPVNAATLQGLTPGKTYAFTVIGECMSTPGSGTTTSTLIIPSARELNFDHFSAMQII